VDELKSALDELEMHGVAEVERDGEAIVVTSRRVAKELLRLGEKREKNRSYYETKVQPKLSQDSVVIQTAIQQSLLDSDISSSERVVLAEGEKEETRARASKSVPCDPDQVRDYALMVHLPDHAAEFFDHFTAAGWRMGNGTGRPIKDWQAAYRNWCRRAPEFTRKNGPTNGRPLTTTQQASRPITERLVEQGYSPDDFR
jgi:hypothetical protein